MQVAQVRVQGGAERPGRGQARGQEGSQGTAAQSGQGGPNLCAGTGAGREEADEAAAETSSTDETPPPNELQEALAIIEKLRQQLKEKEEKDVPSPALEMTQESVAPAASVLVDINQDDQVDQQGINFNANGQINQELPKDFDDRIKAAADEPDGGDDDDSDGSPSGDRGGGGGDGDHPSNDDIGSASWSEDSDKMMWQLLHEAMADGLTTNFMMDVTVTTFGPSKRKRESIVVMEAELLACESAYLWCVTVTVHKHLERILARAHQWVQAKVINYV